MKQSVNSVSVCIASGLIFFFAPFWGMLCAIYGLYKYKVNDRGTIFLSFLIALFWGLLAYTQESRSLGLETDITRYYDMFGRITSQINFPKEILALIHDDLAFVFVPLTTLFVYTTHSLQVIPLFWVTLTYFMFFLSICHILKKEQLYTTKEYARYLLVLMICAMLFVQISETIKNAAAFSVAFYAFSLFYAQKSHLKVLVWLIVAIGIHPSVLLLLPCFLYKHCHTRVLLALSFVLFPIAINIDIFRLIAGILPTGGYIGELSQKANAYVASEKTSIRYLVISFSTLVMAAILYKHGKSKDNYLCNIVLIYFLVSSFNACNIHSYVRFINFIHPIIFILLLASYKTQFKYNQVIMQLYLLFLLFFTLRLTIGRTVTGGYLSSYMDNSLSEILFSSVNDYLVYKTYPL